MVYSEAGNEFVFNIYTTFRWKKASQLNLHLMYDADMHVYYCTCKCTFFYILKHYMFIGI